MTNKLLEKIMSLLSDGYEVRFMPFYVEDGVEIRLSKNYHHVARIIDLIEIHQCKAWKSEEDAFIYYLDCLVDEYEKYVRKIFERKKL